MSVNANAAAHANTFASASATARSGIYQIADAPTVSQTITNSGSVTLGAHASALATHSATAAAFAIGAVFQTGLGGNVNQAMTNAAGGTIDVGATAIAHGADYANAVAIAAAAMVQSAVAASSAHQAMTNAGTINVVANATAVGAGAVVGTGTTAHNAGTATARASAYGIGQYMNAATGISNLTNSGTLDVQANAVANGLVSANAEANGTGAWQVAEAGSPQLNFTNSGTINVDMHAVAGGVATGTATNAAISKPTGTAEASAFGYVAAGYAGQAVNLTAVNSGKITVTAAATGPDFANANAVGIEVNNAPTLTTVGTGTTAHTVTVSHPVAGSITNSGTIAVLAKANGLGTTATTVVHTATGGATSKVVTTHPHSSAHATGIRVNGGVNAVSYTTSTTTAGGKVTPHTHTTNLTINNSGSIDVTAITNGGAAQAYGIRVTSNGTATPAAGALLTINNSGDITARLFDRWRNDLPPRRSDRCQRSSQPERDQPSCRQHHGQYRACEQCRHDQRHGR